MWMNRILKPIGLNINKTKDSMDTNQISCLIIVKFAKKIEKDDINQLLKRDLENIVYFSYIK
jgi:hypothetical protein